jgi:hypothetical protein
MWICLRCVTTIYCTRVSASFISLKIELKAEDLYDKEKVDLETIVIDDVFKLLQCDDNGLNPEEALRRLELFGPNKLESEEQNAFFQARGVSLPQRKERNLLISYVLFSSSVLCGIHSLGSWRQPP